MVKELGSAINRAVERSREVAEAIESLRAAGYQIELTLRLEIGLRPPEAAKPPAPEPVMARRSEDVKLELTEEDLRTLRRMKIRFD